MSGINDLISLSLKDLAYFYLIKDNNGNIVVPSKARARAIRVAANKLKELGIIDFTGIITRSLIEERRVKLYNVLIRDLKILKYPKVIEIGRKTVSAKLDGP